MFAFLAALVFVSGVVAVTFGVFGFVKGAVAATLVAALAFLALGRSVETPKGVNFSHRH